MATKLVLAELAGAYTARSGVAVNIESVGGVDAAKRVQGGEAFDLVFLAANAIDKLIASGQVLPGSRVDLVRSGVAVAVQAGAPHPSIADEAAVREAVLQAPSVSYSTGPSGVALAEQFQRWGIAEQVQAKLVTAPPGVPVGSLVAKGEVALGFQQYSELMHLSGIDVLGALPEAIQIVTTFSAGICTACQQPDAARALLAYMTSADAETAIRREGMEPA